MRHDAQLTKPGNASLQARSLIYPWSLVPRRVYNFSHFFQRRTLSTTWLSLVYVSVLVLTAVFVSIMDRAMDIDVDVYPIDPQSLPEYALNVAQHDDEPGLELSGCLRAREQVLHRLAFDAVQIKLRGMCPPQSGFPRISDLSRHRLNTNWCEGNKRKGP